MLEALSANHVFQGIVSAEDVHRGKPDPEVYVLAASRVGVPARGVLSWKTPAPESRGRAAPVCGA